MPSLNTKLASAPNTTSNFVLRATSSTTIGNSTIQDDGTNVAIGTTPGTYKLNVSGTFNATGAATFSSSIDASGQINSSISSNSGSGSSYPLNRISNTLATQGDGSSTFNFSALLVQSGNGAVQFYHSTSYAAGTWEPQGLLNVATNHPLVIRTNNTERMRITSGGDIGIGTTGGINITSGWTNLTVNGTSTGLIGIKANGTDFGAMYANIGNNNFVLQAYGTSNTGNMVFLTNSTTRVTINGSTGTALFNGGNTADVNNVAIRVPNNKFLSFYNAADNGWAFALGANSDNSAGMIGNNGISFGTGGSATTRMTILSGGAIQMSNNSTTFSIGSIAGVQRIQYGTGGFTTEFAFLQPNDGYTPIGASAFNTRSDYRLKEDLKEFNGLSLVTDMKVYDFKWREKEERNYGFMAHELQEVVPYVVTGTKDGMFEDEPQMQGLDYSKLVPILVKSIQELETRIKQLENK
jgi:hypothetical protein